MIMQKNPGAPPITPNRPLSTSKGVYAPVYSLQFNLPKRNNWIISFLYAMLYYITFIFSVNTSQLLSYAQESDGIVEGHESNPSRQLNEGDIESNHFFCGTDWNTVGNNCDGAQHCPSGLDDECELFGAVCFAGTSCDAAKGHGKMFEFLGLPYEDTRNNLFCASSWAEAGSNCSVEYWCKDGMCDNGMSCFGAPDCNIQDIINAQLDAEKEANGDTDETEIAKEPLMAEDDPKRNNFCGMTWGDASWQCQDWCPEGTECPEPQTCFADTTCYYDKDIAPSASPTTYPPTGSPTVTYDKAENMSFCGSCWSDAQECTIERHCPNGDTDCPPSQTCYNYIPGCNIVDLIKKQKPVPPPSMPPTRRPTGHPSLDGETPIPTYTPTIWTIGWIDNQTPEPTTSHSSFNNPPSADSPTKRPTWLPVKTDDRTKRYCGIDWADVTENCLTAIPCPGGDAQNECPSGMKCIAETPCADETYLSWLNGEKADNVETDKGEDMSWSESTELNGIGADEVLPTANTNGHVSTPSPADNDISDTFFCGLDRNDALASCHKRCRSGSPGECPGGETCFGYISCASETPRPPTHMPTSMPTSMPTPMPTQMPTPMPTPMPTKELMNDPTTKLTFQPVMQTSPLNNIGMRQNYCATSKAALELTCINAATCNTGDPPCEQGMYCWGDHLCTVSTSGPTTYHPTTNIPIPTYEPTAPPEMKATTKPTMQPTPIPTMLPTKNKEQGKLDSGIPELYCASSMSELEASCNSAQSCSDGPCAKGMFCFPFSCESMSKDEQISLTGETFYCASSFAELDEKCGLATECTGKEKACLKNQYCLPYNCKQSLDKCPLNFIGWHASPDCKLGYECANGVIAGEVKTCGPFFKFDKVRGRCVEEKQVNDNCYGSPATEIEVKGNEETTSMPGTRPINFCPNGYVGWQSRDGKCKEYYECRRDGSIGPTRVCPEGTKFNKTRGVCSAEKFVNSSCYANASVSPTDLCPHGYMGWQSRDGKCKEYYECRRDGSIGPTHLCPDGAKFDKARGVCSAEEFVNSSCYGKTSVNPTELCPNGYVGWQSRDGHCKEYYECRRNGSISPTRVCGEGTKFDKTRGVCYDEDFVNSSCYDYSSGSGSSSSSNTNTGASSLGDLNNYPHQAGTSSGLYHGGDANTQDLPDGAGVNSGNASGNHSSSGYSYGNQHQDVFSSANAGGVSNGSSGNGDNQFKTGPETYQPAVTSHLAPTQWPVSDSTSSRGDDYRDDTWEVLGSTSGGDDGSSYDKWSETYPPAISPDANSTEVPPWYHTTIADPNRGETYSTPFMSKFGWMLSMGSIQWMIMS